MSEPLLLIHPVGVGLSSRFWERFRASWQRHDTTTSLLAPDLLGCGGATMEKRALTAADWAAPLVALLHQSNSEPVVLVSQGASLPIALAVIEQAPDRVSRLVAISPPGWRVLSEPFPEPRSRQLWRLLFSGAIGGLFYRYARRRGFLRSFSEKNLFAEASAVDEEWLTTLEEGSKAMASRWAVFSFLAGFWRRNWEQQLCNLTIPVLVVFGQDATGIGRSKGWDDADERIATFKSKLPQAEIRSIPGRNVLPYESAEACVDAVHSWLKA